MDNNPSDETIKKTFCVLTQSICIALYGNYDPYTNSFDNTGLSTTHPELTATKELENSLKIMVSKWKEEGIELKPVTLKN